MAYKLDSPFTPTGDQPNAIKEIVEGINANEPAQVLLGVTGSGKTFTMANVIAKLNRPTLILTHNKTLTAQLYGEFQDFFPDNAVEFFVSYYDYYQPEAYLSVTDTYIEKDLQINEEVDKLRLRATSSLLSGRRDVIIVASVSCIYGMGNPDDFQAGIIRIKQGEVVSRNDFLYRLVEILYSRTETDFARATFRVRGDTVDINLPYVDYGMRVTFFFFIAARSCKKPRKGAMPVPGPTIIMGVEGSSGILKVALDSRTLTKILFPTSWLARKFEQTPLNRGPSSNAGSSTTLTVAEQTPCFSLGLEEIE